MTAPAIDLEELLSDEIACRYYNCSKPASWKLVEHNGCTRLPDNCFTCEDCRKKILTPEEIWAECSRCNQTFGKASAFYHFRRI